LRPGSTASLRCFRQGLSGPSVNTDLLEFALGEKTNEAVVGRPEGERGAFRSCQRPRRERIERSNPQVLLASIGNTDESQVAAVGGNLDSAFSEANSLGRMDLEARGL